MDSLAAGQIEEQRKNIGKSKPEIIDKSVDSSYHLTHTTG